MHVRSSILAKVRIVAIILIAAHQCALAQPVVGLVRAIDAPAGRADVATSVAPIEGGAVIAGWTTNDAGNEDGLLMRVSADGDVIWRRELGGKGDDLLWSVLSDGDGGFICAGYTSSAGAGDTDGWIVRVDADGKTSWERTFGPPGEDKFFTLQRDVGANGGWVAVGQTAPAGKDATDLNVLVVHIDKAGKERGTTSYGGPALDRAFATVALDDGGVAIGGMTGADRDHAHAFVARLGPDGTKRWQRTLDHLGFSVVHDLHLAPNGDLLAFGYATSRGRSDPDGFLVRLSAAAGDSLAKHTFGGSTADRALHARCFDDGSSMIVGYSQRAGTGNPDTLWDLCIWRLDADGKLIWTNRFGGDNTEFGRAIAGAPDNLWIVGHTASAGAKSEAFVVRLNARG